MLHRERSFVVARSVALVLAVLAGTALTAVPSARADPSAPPTVSLFGVQAWEGSVGNRAIPVTVRLSRPLTSDLLVGYSVSNSTATSPSDFNAKSGTVKIRAGKVGAYISVAVVGDDVAEPDENVTVALTSVSQPSVVLGTNGFVTTSNDDVNPAAQVYASFVGSVEGDQGQFNMKVPVVLTRPVAQDVVLSYTTNDGDAIPGVDYRAESGAVTIRAGRTIANISIIVYGDATSESLELFAVYLTPGPGFPSGVTIGNGTGLCLIIDDD
jgi:hypothetical protein